MFESRALIVITNSQFSPEVVRLMKNFWSQAGTTVKIAIDRRYESIKNDLRRHNLTWELDIHEIVAMNHDFVVFVGSIALERCNEKVYLSIIQETRDLEKSIGAIGCAVLLLAEYRLLTGYNATGCRGIKEHMVEKGIKYTDKEFTVTEHGVHTCKESGAIECAYDIAYWFHVCKLPVSGWMKEVREKLEKAKQSIKVHQKGGKSAFDS